MSTRKTHTTCPELPFGALENGPLTFKLRDVAQLYRASSPAPQGWTSLVTTFHSRLPNSVVAQAADVTTSSHETP